MNRIEMLIEELCPQGVKFKALGEVGKVSMCKRIFKNQTSTTGQIPFYKIGTFGNTPNAFISQKIFDEYRRKFSFPKKGDVLLSASGTIGRRVIYDGEPAYFQDSNIIWIDNDESKVLNMFLFYLYTIVKWQTEGGTIKRLYNDNLKKIQIPIPPLTIQKEIVKILDNFTQLEAELEAELTARKKQYEHYREELLSFGDDVEFRALGEVGKFLRGSAITAKETTVGEIPVVANAPKPIYFHGESNRTGETIVVSRSGAYCGLVSFWKQPIFITDAFSIHLETTLLKPKFIYYFLKKNQKTIHSMKKGYGVPHVRVKDFESYSVPIPPISKQKEIVAILDKFDALVNDISMGLPAEIAARKKQYEYYRNQLLTFKPLEAQDAN